MTTRGAWIGGALVALLAAGCGKKAESDAAAQRPTPPVQVANAERRDLALVQTYTGSVEPVKVARMASPAEGPVVACAVREGDAVTNGQMLVKVGRSRIAESGLDAAREEFRRQESEFKRVERLVHSGALPGDQLDAARANLKRAEAQLAAMETGAGDYEIAAPWDGIVSKVWISEGNYVAPRAPLVELYDPASLVVRFSVPERRALSIAAGQTVAVTLDAYPGRKFMGRIVRVYPELDRGTRTVTAEAVLEGEARLLSGMFARVEVEVEKQSAAVVIPEAALVVLPNGETVVFVVEGEKAARRKVNTGLEAGGLVAIVSGVEPGELVVTCGQDALKDGAALKVMGAGGKKEGGGGGGGAAPTPAGKDAPAS